MRDARPRLVRGAAAVVAAVALFTAGWHVYAHGLLMNSSDGALVARFRGHRAEFEELLDLERAHARALGTGAGAADSARRLARLAASDRRWLELTRRLRLDRDNLRISDSLVYFASSAWFPRRRFQDVKGYAYSSRPPDHLVEDLDLVVTQPGRPGRAALWHRPIGEDWYLYRQVGRERR